MIKAFLVFVIVFAVVYGVIEGFRMLSNSEKWSLVKSLGYSATIAALAVVLLTVFVILF